jgi:hypothetical protein
MKITKTFEDPKLKDTKFEVEYDLCEAVENPEEWAVAFAEKYGWDVLKDLAIGKAKIAVQTKTGNIYKKHPTYTPEQIQAELSAWKLGVITRMVGRSADEVTREYLLGLKKTDPAAFEKLMEEYLEEETE